MILPNSHTATPEWDLSENWGVGRDSHNWILYHKSKKTWTAKGYYPSPETLLKSFFRQLTRTESADPDLVRHIESISRRVEAAAARLYGQIDTRQAERSKTGPAAQVAA